VISHIYHGGSIFGSHKSTYAERLGSDNLEIQVRALMERQHKNMLERLQSGEFDAVISERLGPVAADQPAAAPAPAPASAPEPVPALEQAAPAAAEPDPDASKPLDEAILDYLVEKQRSRATSSRRRPKE
jgi:hypothetical protein